MTTKTFLKDISFATIGCIIEVHKNLGPGLLESVYQLCLVEELKSNGISFKNNVHVPVRYKDADVGGILKIDLLIEDVLILELKAVETMHPVYKAQLLTYLKLADKPKGLLVNFNCEIIKDNITSIVTEKFRSLAD